MKNIVLAVLLCSSSMSFATYQVVFPNQNVTFKSNDVQETFSPTDPLISEWSNIGSAYDCNNYTPDPSS